MQFPEEPIAIRLGSSESNSLLKFQIERSKRIAALDGKTAWISNAIFTGKTDTNSHAVGSN